MPDPARHRTDRCLCENYDRDNICDWAVLREDSHPLRKSGQLTRVSPDLSQQRRKEAWHQLEVPKGRREDCCESLKPSYS